MKILITGGTGLIGSALAHKLAQADHAIIILSRAPEKARGLPARVQLVKWDGRSANGWAEHAEGADAIVNLAGEPIAPRPWWGDRKEKIRASRVNAGRAIVQAVERAKQKPRAVIQSSAIGYYGLHGDEVVTEQDAAGRDYLASVCVDWEAATAPVEALGVRRAVYRTGLVLSRTGGILPMMALPFYFFVGGKLGSGKQWMSWIHLEDELAALHHLIENEQARGVYNFTAPNPVRNEDFARTLGRALRRPSFIPTPALALKLAFGEMADLLLLGGQRVVPTHLTADGFQFRFPTLESAVKDIYDL